MSKWVESYYPRPDMIDYDIQRCSRRCAASDRELHNGEVCYSVLVPEGGQVVRRDYSAEGWPGPPEGAIGWWKSAVLRRWALAALMRR